MELSGWNFSLFKELYKENPFSLNLRENPIVTNTGKVIVFDDLDGYDFYSMIFTGYSVIRKKNLRNALYLIKHNANISSYTWRCFLDYLISPFENSSNSFYDKERRKIAELDDLITDVILGLIRVGADPFIFSENRENSRDSENSQDYLEEKRPEVQKPSNKYLLFKALSIIGNKKIIEELSKDLSIASKIQELIR